MTKGAEIENYNSVHTEMANGVHHQLSTGKYPDFKAKIRWEMALTFMGLHLCALYGLYLYVFHATWQTMLFAIFYFIFSGLGITAGAHRLWAHRAYKAKLPLRILLAVMCASAWQWDIHFWCKDHRAHHKYTDTNADPHNSNRGFFFSHIGWLILKRHPQVTEKLEAIEDQDLLADPVVQFQRRFYVPLALLICFLLPTGIPLLWGENIFTAFFVAGMLRFVVLLHVTFCVNSAAHMWGNKPYDKFINPSENLYLTGFALGEGFHNYHHTFPWDYATSEYGIRLNLTTLFIDFMAWLGLAYDCKTVSPQMIKERRQRTGDGSDYKNKVSVD